MANDDEVFKNFLIEIAERLAEFDQGLRELEQAYNVNHINLLFRAIHTIKGGAGFFGLNKITELTHLLEDLLMKIREGDVAFDAAMMPALYAASDCLNDMQQDASYGEQMDIGVNSGEVILGNLGSTRHRLEYAMVGDNVNIGQRLESAAPNTKCMISEATYLLAKDKVLVGEKSEIKVKGKAEPVIAYVIEGLQ